MYFILKEIILIFANFRPEKYDFWTYTNDPNSQNI
jgi:hypothetical protein